MKKLFKNIPLLVGVLAAAVGVLTLAFGFLFKAIQMDAGALGHFGVGAFVALAVVAAVFLPFWFLFKN